MCGIVGFIGKIIGFKMAYNGIKMLENRGYDSAGICSIDSAGVFHVNKYVSNGEKAIAQIGECEDEHQGNILCLHTRWATTGIVSPENSHPHLDYKGRFSVVHNGIIENYLELKDYLEKAGIKFKSQTDTEVIVNMISYYYEKVGVVKKAIEMTLNRIEGTWGLIVMSTLEPNKMYCVRHGSPLLIGLGQDYVMVASEQSGFYKYVNNYVCLDEHDLLTLHLTSDGVQHEIDNYELKTVNNDEIILRPDPYNHWTIREIMEQVKSTERAMGNYGRIIGDNSVKLGGLEPHKEVLKRIDNIILLGCGTSYHAAQYCSHVLKEIGGFNTVQVYDGAEFTNTDIPGTGASALIILSQSGETADLKECIKIGQDKDLFMLGVVNVVDSMIARLVHCGVYLNAGREVGVASTKVFTSQVIVLYLIAVWFSQIKNTSLQKRRKIIKSLRSLPNDIMNTLNDVRQKSCLVADYFNDYSGSFILGKEKSEAIAKEGSLKIKEIGYMHIQGYSSSALKHGPFALLEKDLPVIFVQPNDKVYTKTQLALEEVKARGSYTICISDIDNQVADLTIQVAKNEVFSSLLCVIPLQIIAYELALKKGHDPDYPRNLAKCVSTL